MMAVHGCGKEVGMGRAEGGVASDRTPPRILREVADLGPGDHACLIYLDDDDRMAALSAYLGQGFAAGERVLWIVDAPTVREIRSYLRHAGAAIGDAEQRGQLVFLTCDQAYLGEGAFDPHRMVALLQQETQRALDDGFTGLRVTGEMTGAQSGSPSSERLTEFEALLNTFFPGTACTGLCQYDARRFPPAALRDVWRTHPIVISTLHADPGRPETEQHWAKLMASLPGMAYRCRNDRDWTMEFVSEGSVDLLGYAPDALVGNREVSYARLIHPADRPRVWDTVEKAIARREPFTLTYRIRTATGEEKLVWERGMAIQGEGEEVLLTGFITDVTARVRMAERVREERDWSEAIIRNAPNIIIGLDRDARIVIFNRFAEELTGYAAPEVMGKDWFTTFLPPEIREETRSVWNEIIAQDLAHHRHENAILTKTGEERVIRWRNTVMKKDGEFRMVLAIGVDVTEWKRDEAKRAQLLQRLAVLHRVSQEITRAAQDPEGIYAVIHRAVAELMPAEALAISLRTGDDEAEAVYLVDEGGRYPPERVPPGEGLTWRVLSTGKPVAIPDVTAGVPFKRRRFGSKESVRSILAVPLRIGERTVGMLAAQSYEPAVYSEEDLRILEMLAAHAAAALANARLLAELRESEGKFRSVFENTVLGLYRTTPEGRIVMANPTLVRMLGYESFEELAQRDLTAEGYEPGYLRREFQERVEREGEVRGLEGAWVRRDGSILFVRESARLIRDETGRPLYYDGTVEDVTELVAARRAREQQDRLLTIAGRMANLGGWYVDLATDQVLWSDEVAAIHEMPPGIYPSVEERISFYVPEHQARIREVFTACATEGIPYDVELQIITRSGRRVWVRTIGEPVRDAAGKIVGVQGALQDITDRKQAEDTLQEREERYRELVEDISDVIIATDADGIVTYISPAARALSGYSPDEIVGQPFARFIHPDDLPGLLQAFQEILSGRQTAPSPFEHRVIAKSGDPIWARTLTKPFFRDGKPAGVRGVMSDISARKRAEAELAESYARIQHLFDAIVDALASTIELRDPYTAGHQRRVAELAVAIARELGLSAEEQTGLRIAGLVHDVGKIVVPSEILSKPGRLSQLEMNMVRVHPEAGFNVLRGIDFPWPVAEVVHQHHERLDGSGYPQGLTGDEILLGARILAVADVVEAISSHRPYRAALGIEAALAEVEAGRGKLYDPQVVDACLAVFRRGFTFRAAGQAG
jgi:PAS domain S-box-containing protein/putative nucleotidyltransferase with HDIG domain